MKKTFSGAASGVGQVYEWTGNKDVGRGRMTVIAVDPGKSVDVKLEFFEPYAAENGTRFDFVQIGEKTTVTWTMTGKSVGFMPKAMTLFMDALVGPDFELGLAQMKAAGEAK